MRCSKMQAVEFARCQARPGRSIRLSQSKTPGASPGVLRKLMCELLAKRRGGERPRSYHHRAGHNRRRIAVRTDRNARAVAIPVDLEVLVVGVERVVVFANAVVVFDVGPGAVMVTTEIGIRRR